MHKAFALGARDSVLVMQIAWAKEKKKEDKSHESIKIPLVALSNDLSRNDMQTPSIMQANSSPESFCMQKIG